MLHLHWVHLLFFSVNLPKKLSVAGGSAASYCWLFAGDGRQLSPYFIKNIIDVRDPPCFYSVNTPTDLCEVGI